MNIYPSILETSIDAFTEQLETLLPLFPHFQIDIADGKFVDNKTVHIEEILSRSQESEFRIQDKTFEFHLMVEDYTTEIQKLNKLKEYMNITLVLIHFQTLHTKYRMLDTEYPFNIGLSLNPEVEIGPNWETLRKFPTIQIMTSHPGKQGQPFLPETLQKITELRDLGYEGTISLDGAMNEYTLPIVLERKHLPDVIYPGSYFNENPKEKLETLVKLITMSSRRNQV